MLTLDPKTALVVVDLQALTVGNAVAVPLGPLRERVADLLAGFREAGSTIAFAISTGTPPGRSAAGADGRVWPDALLELDEGLTVGSGGAPCHSGRAQRLRRHGPRRAVPG
ncbi:hypothetical protein [Pseudoclavibacter helvolus]|uniref:hypothetical protein n=1 Tax=Pseudoclavibacter helvolus TaxID=255205 RepID=UPI0008383AC6|nr:hypothetical protein [Pseudoclavibacter helvolus]